MRLASLEKSAGLAVRRAITRNEPADSARHRGDGTPPKDGRIEIDNNAAERALRSAAPGRKDYSFDGSNAGDDRGAGVYSLIGSAKLNGIDPEADLCEVFARIADHPVHRIDDLLPWNLEVLPAADQAAARLLINAVLTGRSVTLHVVGGIEILQVRR